MERGGRSGSPTRVRVACFAAWLPEINWSGQARTGWYFPWERDGWTHLYSAPIEGGTATLLTPGEFEVEHVTYSADGSEIVYSSNQVASDPKDADRRHIWRVSSAGGRPPAAVTDGAASEWSPVLVTGGIAYLRGDAKRPARAMVQLGAGSRELAPETIPADFPTDDLVVPAAGDLYGHGRDAGACAALSAARRRGGGETCRHWSLCTAGRGGRCCSAGITWTTTTTPTR